MAFFFALVTYSLPPRRAVHGKDGASEGELKRLLFLYYIAMYTAVEKMQPAVCGCVVYTFALTKQFKYGQKQLLTYYSYIA